MRAADRLGLPYIYRAVDLAEHGLDPSEIGEVLYLAEALGYDALNITHPCKTLVLPYLNELDERAAALQTVNTVLLKRGQRTGTTPTGPVSCVPSRPGYRGWMSVRWHWSVRAVPGCPSVTPSCSWGSGIS